MDADGLQVRVPVEPDIALDTHNGFWFVPTACRGIDLSYAERDLCGRTRSHVNGVSSPATRQIAASVLLYPPTATRPQLKNYAKGPSSYKRWVKTYVSFLRDVLRNKRPLPEDFIESPLVRDVCCQAAGGRYMASYADT